MLGLWEEPREPCHNEEIKIENYPLHYLLLQLTQQKTEPEAWVCNTTLLKLLKQHQFTNKETGAH